MLLQASHGVVIMCTCAVRCSCKQRACMSSFSASTPLILHCCRMLASEALQPLLLSLLLMSMLSAVRRCVLLARSPWQNYLQQVLQQRFELCTGVREYQSGPPAQWCYASCCCCCTHQAQLVLLHERPEYNEAQHACCSNRGVERQPAGQSTSQQEVAGGCKVLVATAVLALLL